MSLQILWAFCKKYWKVMLLVIGAIATFVLFKEQSASFADELKKINDAHDEEIKKIQDAEEQERKEHEANVKRLQDTLDVVQKKYDEQKKELDDQKKAEVEQIVKDYGDDPTELAKKLSEATGFDVVLPK